MFLISYKIYEYITKDFFKLLSKIFFSKNKQDMTFIYSDYLRIFYDYLLLNYINLYSSIFMIFIETYLSNFIISNLYWNLKLDFKD